MCVSFARALQHHVANQGDGVKELAGMHVTHMCTR